MNLWPRKRRLSGVFVCGQAPGRPACSLPLETVIEQVRLDAGPLDRFEYPLWDMFWPPPEPENSGMHVTLGYDERRRR